MDLDSPGLRSPLPSHWVPHLGMVTVYIVQHMSEDLWGDAMQGDNWGLPRGCRFLALSKVVIQQGPEVVAAATEESLREKSSESTRAGICPQGANPSRDRRGTGTLWQRKLESATRKQISGQLLKPSGHGKGSSPRSPWQRKSTHQSKAVREREAASRAGLGGEPNSVGLYPPQPHP